LFCHKPLTSSDSASAKSKGALICSATDLIKINKNKGNNGTNVSDSPFELLYLTVIFLKLSWLTLQQV